MSPRFYLVISLAGLVSALGCGSSERAVETAAREGVLLIGNGAEPKTLDPHQYGGVPESRIFWALFEGLTTADPKDLSVRPGVAETWDVSEDGTVYTFKLRDDAKWSNGDPITAQDFIYSWRRILNPKLGAVYASMLYPMKNAEAYHQGEIDDPELIGAEAIDDHTLRVELRGPTPYFLNLHIHFTWMPVHKETIEKHGDPFDPGNPGIQAGNMVSHGPMKLVEWEPNRIIRVEKNEHYWDRKTVKLNEVRYFPVVQQQTEERMFRVGDIHALFQLLPTKVDTYRRDYPESLRIHQMYATGFYRFNSEKPPLDNAIVRRALAMAINKRLICEEVLRAGHVPADTFVPPGPIPYDSNATLPFDADQARQLLAEAGYPDGEGFPQLTITYNTLEQNRDVAESIQAMWREELGIDVELENVEWKVYLERASQGDFEVARAGWYGDFVDPMTFLELAETGNGNNWGRYSNPEYDALLDKARDEPDPAKRFEILAQAEAVILRDAPFAPIRYYVEPAVIAPQVQGWHPNVLAYLSFKDLAVEPVGDTN